MAAAHAFTAHAAIGRDDQPFGGNVFEGFADMIGDVVGALANERLADGLSVVALLATGNTVLLLLATGARLLYGIGLASGGEAWANDANLMIGVTLCLAIFDLACLRARRMPSSASSALSGWLRARSNI